MIAPTIGLTSAYTDYVLLDKQNPPAAAGFTRIPADRQNSWMNAGYTVQWWLFSALALVLFGWAARREAHDRRDGIDRRSRGDRPRDRLSKDRLAGDPAGGVTSTDHVGDDVPADRPRDDASGGRLV
jgi:hypothetical protein